MDEPKAIQIHFEQVVLPRIRTHANIAFRGLNTDAKEEAVQETLALAWLFYQRELEKGKKPDGYISHIARFAAAQVQDGRGINGQEKAKDVLSRRAQRRKGFSVQAFPPDSAQDGQVEALKRRRETPPDEAAAFRHDYPLFLSTLPQKKRAVIEDAAQGDDGIELAEKHRLTQGRISQIRGEARGLWAELCQPKDERER